MDAPLVPSQGARPLGLRVREAARGGRGAVMGPGGPVVVDLSPAGIEEGVARYELRIENGTAATLAAYAYGVRGEETPTTALSVAIEPRAAVRLDVALAADGPPYDRVTAEVRGEGVQVVVDAEPPRVLVPALATQTAPAPPPPTEPPAVVEDAALPALPQPSVAARRFPWFVAVAAAAIALGAIASALARPHVTLAAFDAVAGNGPLTARYATRGNGTRTYALYDRAGNERAAGVLDAPQGSFAIAVPAGNAARLQVRIANLFGSDERDATLVRSSPPPPLRIAGPPRPEIAAIALDAPPRAGEPYVVHYDVRARALRLTVVGNDGRPWFAADAAPGRGAARVPSPSDPSHFALVARATIGRAAVESRVALPSLAQPSPSPSPSALLTLPPAPALAGDAIGVRPQSIRAGEPFVVDVPSADRVHVAVVRDRDGAELRSVEAAGTQRTLALVAPEEAGTYTLRVTLDRGNGSETLVRPLLIRR